MNIENKIRIGALGTFLVLMLGTGMVGATTITATYNSTYQPATCVLGVVNASAVNITSIDLSSGSGTLYVGNVGSADSLGNPSTMSVNVAFQDNSGSGVNVAPAGSGGWYQGSTWIDNISTTWSSSQYTPSFFALQGLGTFSEGPAYSSLASGSGWNPITFDVNAGVLPAGSYNQEIVISESC